MKLLPALRVCLLLVGAAITLSAQATSTQIETLLKRYHEYGLFNGAALVAANGKVIHKAGYGKADMEWDVPNTPDTRFRIGSITKQFTSAIILQLVDEGKLKLENPLSHYLPDYPSKTADKVTIHHLLNHTSGIPSYTSRPGFVEQHSRDPYSVSEFIKTFSSLDLEFEPGTKYSYNNSGYFLLGAIIEKVEGSTYEEVLRKRFVEPLGLSGTGYDWHAPILAKRARGYESTLEGYRNAPYLDMSLPYSAGSMYSTVEDLYKWDQALYTDAVLPAATRELWFKPGLENYGYGWMIREAEKPGGDSKITLVEHGGGINGFNTLISRIPADKHLVVLFSNAGGAPLGAMAEGIRQILYGQAAAMPKKPAAPLLLETYNANGIQAALAQYREWRSKDDAGIDTGNRELPRLARHLMMRKEAGAAVSTMTLHTETFPSEWQGYVGLGDAQKANGERDKARKSYARALELCPEGTAGFVLNKVKELLP